MNQVKKDSIIVLLKKNDSLSNKALKTADLKIKQYKNYNSKLRKKFKFTTILLSFLAGLFIII